MISYREYDYEMWCRRRAAALGDSDGGGLYWRIYRWDRGIFEEGLRERDRNRREPSELTELVSILEGVPPP